MFLFLIILIGIIYLVYKTNTHFHYIGTMYDKNHFNKIGPTNALAWMQISGNLKHVISDSTGDKLDLTRGNAAIYKIPGDKVQFEPSVHHRKYYLVNVSFNPQQQIYGGGYDDGYGYDDVSVNSREIDSPAILTLITEDKRYSFNVGILMLSNEAAYLKENFMVNDYKQRQLGLK